MASDAAFTDSLLLPQHIAHNSRVLAFNRVFASLVAGCAIGIVGYSGWAGFLWYLIMHVVVSSIVWNRRGSCSHKVGELLMLKVRRNTKPYFQSRWMVYTFEVMSSTSLLTFVLFWTLAYNIVHLF